MMVRQSIPGNKHHICPDAGAIVDKNGTPRFFIFDSFALLDVLSAIDEKLVDRLSTEAYHSKTINPAGWLIDHIEERLPLTSAYVQTLRDAIAEAEEKGWIPFEIIEKDLNLAPLSKHVPNKLKNNHIHSMGKN